MTHIIIKGDAYIVMTGNPIDGFTCYGPFTTHAAALNWADPQRSDFEWWIAPLYIPEELK